MRIAAQRIGAQPDDILDMAGRIVAALKLFGGEAHSKLIIEYIQSSARDMVARKNIGDAVIATFERLAADEPHRDAIFFRRFGPGSQRWSLGPGAEASTADALPDWTRSAARA